MLDTYARTEQFNQHLQALRQPAHGPAHLDVAGPGTTVTAGTYPDGSPARWQLSTGALWPADRLTARNTTVIGATRSGKTVLLHSIAQGAHHAGVPAQIIDLAHGQLTGLPHPIATTIDTARTVLTDLDELARARHHQSDPQQRLQLLVIDGLCTLTADPAAAHLLYRLSLRAAEAGIAILAGTQQNRLRAFGAGTLGPDAATALRKRLTQEPVLLRTANAADPQSLDCRTDLPHIPEFFTGDGYTSGVGLLPRRSPVPFRTWLPRDLA